MGVYIHTADGLPLRTTWVRAASAALYAYDAFGFGSAGGSVSFPHRFSTKPYDEDLMLSDFGRRWYWPEIRRWISRDPIEEEGGDNLYVFCMNKPTFFLDALGELSVKPSKANDGCSAKVIQLYFEQSKSNGLFDRLTESIREPYKKSIRDHFWKMTFVLRTNAEYGECQGKNGNTPRMGVYDDIDVSSQLTLPGGQQYTMVTHHPKQWHTLAYLCISQLCHKPSLENWLRTAIHETAHNIGWGNYYKDAEQSSFDNFDQNERHPNQSEWRIPNGNDTSPNSLNCSFPSFR